MKYFKEFVVQYQDVDADRKLRLYTLENYLLNIASNVADECGFGIKNLGPEGLTWILTRLSLEMDYLPTNCETIVIETWIESYTHGLSTRNFRIWRCNKGERELIGRAKSVWAVLDMEKREIVNCAGHPALKGGIDGEVLEMARAARPVLITEPDGVSEHVVQYSDVDYNRHCNSCHYLEIMQNTKLFDLRGGGFRLDISYSKEVFLGERLTTLYVCDENSIQYTQRDENGSTCCIAKLTLL